MFLHHLTPNVVLRLSVYMGVFGSLHKAYPGLWNGSHQCLVACIGSYAGFPGAKVGVWPTYGETQLASVPGYAGFLAPLR
jgi:hypothetical protein